MDEATDAKAPGKTRGKPTFYPGKIQKSISAIMTPEGRDELEHCQRFAESQYKLKLSVSDLLEHAWRAHRGIALNEELVTLLQQVPRQ
jgi:hypothetical protein